MPYIQLFKLLLFIYLFFNGAYYSTLVNHQDHLLFSCDQTVWPVSKL